MRRLTFWRPGVAASQGKTLSCCDLGIPVLTAQAAAIGYGRGGRRGSPGMRGMLDAAGLTSAKIHGRRRHSAGRKMLVANCPHKLTRVRALAGIFLVVSMCATLQAHTLAAALCGKGHAFGSGGTGSAFAVGFSNDFVAHGTLSSLVKLAIVPHSLGLFLAARN